MAASDARDVLVVGDLNPDLLVSGDDLVPRFGQRERYAPPLRACAELGHSVAWFGTPTAEGGVTPLTHRNFLADHRGCPGSSVYDSDGGVVQVMGAPPDG